MTGRSPDFIAIGGPDSPAAAAALTSAQLGRATGFLTADSLPQEEREALLAARVEIAFGPQRLRAEHIPWSWLDAEIVLASPAANELDTALLGRFNRSLIGVVGEQNAALPGVGALFLHERDDGATPLTAPMALSVNRDGRFRLLWQGAWHDIPSAESGGDVTGAPPLAPVAAAFLVRLTETRDALSAARFASATLTVLQRFDSPAVPNNIGAFREEIAALEARLPR